MNSTPIKPNDAVKLIDEAKTIIGNVNNWKKGKTFQQLFHNEIIQVQSFHEVLNGEDWYARSTILTRDSTSKYKEKFFKYLIGGINLLENHSTHEKEYIDGFYELELKPFDESSYLMKGYYRLPFPMKKRVFYEWIHIINEQENKSAYVISISLDPDSFEDGKPIDNKFVVGHYTSIEYIKVINDELNWTMCTASTPGGRIPKWLTRMTVPGAIAKDVPRFLEYIDQ